MRRAVLKGGGWGTSVNTFTYKQLPIPARTDAQIGMIRCPSPAGPSRILRRQVSSFERNSESTTNTGTSIPQSRTTALVRASQNGLSSAWRPALSQLRPFNSTSHLQDAPRNTDRQDLVELEKTRREEEEEDHLDDQPGFERSEKASRAAQVNLSARLQSSGKAQAN
jgi:putative ABC transport system ATP-binding protein